MKTLKSLIVVFAVVIITGNVLLSQTVNLYPKAIVTNGMTWCMNMPVTGYVIYHLTYHIDKKTGYADRLHANVHKAELVLTATGEKLLYLDTANDDSGVGWSFWNETTMGGENSFVYDKASYDVPIGELPANGGYVWATFKLMSQGGEKYTAHQVIRFILNSDGELEVISNKESFNCNE
jgi:hypothetical protein